MKDKKREQHLENSPTLKMGVNEWILLTLLSLFWGGSFFFVEIAVRTVTPLTIVLTRVGLASIFLMGFVLLTRRKLPGDIKTWGAFLVMGALNNLIPFVLIVWAQTHIQSSLASILNATTPVFTVLLAHLLTNDEPLTINRGTGVVIGWIGVTVLIGLDLTTGFNASSGGQIAVLGAAFSYALAGIYGRRFRGLDPVVVAAGMLTMSTFIMIPVVVITDFHGFPPSFDVTWLALIGLALISTSLAYIIYFQILAKAGATNLLLVTFLIPVSAIFLGVVVLGETLHWGDLAGMGLIFSGLICIDGRLLKQGREMIRAKGLKRLIDNALRQ